MKIMKQFTVISVDMFQTLVNVNSRRKCFWGRLLPHELPGRITDEYWSLATELIFSNYDKIFRENKEFINSKTIMEISFRQLFKQTGLGLQPADAARVLTEEHGLSSPYEDTGEFLQHVGKYFPICVVSDADDDMIRPLSGLYQFDKIFTSEQYRSYKGSPGGMFFQAVIDHYGVAPEKILHIGDSKYDVLGAKRAGIKDCWLNRKGKKWGDVARPTYMVSSLREVSRLLLGEVG